MTGESAAIVDFSAFKRDREHPYDCAVNLEQELYASSDGTVWPIRDWLGIDGEPCGKDDAVYATAGGDDSQKGPWFGVWLASFGLGPHQDKIRAMLADKSAQPKPDAQGSAP